MGLFGSRRKTPVQLLRNRAIEDEELLNTVEFKNRQEGRKTICTVAVFLLYLTTHGRTTNSASRRALRRLNVLIRYKPLNATFEQDLRIFVAREFDGRVIFEKSAEGAIAKVYRRIECSGRSDDVASQMVLDKLAEIGASKRRTYGTSRELDVSPDIGAAPRDAEEVDEQGPEEEDFVEPEIFIKDRNPEEAGTDNPGANRLTGNQRSRWAFEPQTSKRNEYAPELGEDTDSASAYFLDTTEHRASTNRDENSRWHTFKDVIRKFR